MQTGKNVALEVEVLEKAVQPGLRRCAARGWFT